MMQIYVYTDFDGTHARSRELLAAAIDEYNAEYNAYEGAACELTGEELVSRIKTGDKGKPYIEGWREFSLSHSGNLWAVLIGEEACGLDVQYAKDADYGRLSRRFFAEEDAAAVEAATGDYCATSGEAATGDSVAAVGTASQRDAFFRIWTRREALVKATGGTVFGEIPAVLGDFVEFEGEEWFIQDVEIIGADEGAFGAMCTRGVPVSIHHYRLQA